MSLSDNRDIQTNPAIFHQYQFLFLLHLHFAITELFSELAVPITDDTCGKILPLHGKENAEITCLLGHPDTKGRGRRAERNQFVTPTLH
jgi:hypothetical protein